MQSFWQGLVLGYGVSVPIGPINVLIMAYALRGFKYGFGIGAGAMSADIIYLLLASIGVSVFLKESPLFMGILSVFGAGFLLYMAYLTYKGADKMLANNDSSEYKKGVLSCYLKGLGLNAINPYVITFWLSVSAFASSTEDVKMSLAGLFVAISSWIFFLPLGVSLSRKFISQKIAKIFAYVSAVLLVIFAVLIIYNQFFKG